jgi:glycosyltransferase involved in cell wall biosynthesis
MPADREKYHPAPMSVVAAIPIYNEQASIGRLVRECVRHVDLVLVVDDGSEDNGGPAAEQSGAVLLRHDTNQGKGAALQTILGWARRDSAVAELVLLDGDGQHDPADIPRLLDERRRRGLDLLVGSRFLGQNNAPLYRLFGLHVLSAAAFLGSGIRLTDSQSGYRVLSRRGIEQLDLHEPGFGIESEMQFIAARHGLSIGETPIQIRYAGAARRSPVAHGVSVLLDTIKMTAAVRPLRMPLLIATPIVAMGIARTRGGARGPLTEQM